MQLPNLFPQRHDGQRLTGLTFLLSEALEHERLAPSRFKAKAILQSHCHEKALLKADAARRVLTAIGVEFHEPEKGCCGMTGSFGFERVKYAMSMKIAEMNLLPAVRGADGFSCRTQIMQGSNRDGIHLAELLLEAFKRAEVPQ